MRRFALAAVLVLLAISAFGFQADDQPRAVDANANYSLWVIRGTNGVCATILDHDGRRYIRPAPGYTVEVVHDDRRPSVAVPFDREPPPVESKGIPYPFPDSKAKGAK